MRRAAVRIPSRPGRLARSLAAIRRSSGSSRSASPRGGRRPFLRRRCPRGRSAVAGERDSRAAQLRPVGIGCPPSGERGRAGGAVSDLFGQEGAWPAPVVRDAAFAAHEAPPAAAGSMPVGSPVRLLTGPVTAAILARDNFDIVVGSATGEVIVWRMDNGQIEPVTNQGGRVDGLATGDRARVVVTLHREGKSDRDGRVRSYYVCHHGRFHYGAEREIRNAGDPVRLLPIVRGHYGDVRADVNDGNELDSPVWRPTHSRIRERSAQSQFCSRSPPRSWAKRRVGMGRPNGWSGNGQNQGVAVRRSYAESGSPRCQKAVRSERRPSTG